MDAKSDADLLLIVVAGDEIERDQAAGIFFRRYNRQLYKFCRRYGNTLGGDDSGVCDLVLMTFQRAFEHADTFDDSGIVNQEHSRARTFRWLSTIATNLVRDWLRSGSERHPISSTKIINPDGQAAVRFGHEGAAEKVLDQTAIQEFTSDDDESMLTISPEKKCLQAALAALTEREREVILLSAEYSIDGRQLRLPPDVLLGLCTRLRTTQANIRTIRKRAFNKVRNYVAANCQASS